MPQSNTGSEVGPVDLTKLLWYIGCCARTSHSPSPCRHPSFRCLMLRCFTSPSRMDMFSWIIAKLGLAFPTNRWINLAMNWRYTSQLGTDLSNTLLCIEPASSFLHVPRPRCIWLLSVDSLGRLGSTHAVDLSLKKVDKPFQLLLLSACLVFANQWWSLTRGPVSS